MGVENIPACSDAIQRNDRVFGSYRDGLERFCGHRKGGYDVHEDSEQVLRPRFWDPYGGFM